MFSLILNFIVIFVIFGILWVFSYDRFNVNYKLILKAFIA